MAGRLPSLLCWIGAFLLGCASVAIAYLMLGVMAFFLIRNIAADPALLDGRPWATMLSDQLQRYPTDLLFIPVVASLVSGTLAFALAHGVQPVEGRTSARAIAVRLARVGMIGAALNSALVGAMIAYRLYLVYT